MATLPELTERLAARFHNVPGVLPTDIDAWLTEALYQYGYSPLTAADIPDDETPLVITLAQIQGARSIAFSVAHYFKYTDGEEAVDKTMVSEQYRKLAADLAAEYERERGVIIGRKSASTFKVMRRIDRDMTVPRRYGWWWRQ
ncbi:hypothetical protein JNUCC32_31065 (plasmid) [Paenibacillus sp. JNUCC32]|uniref:hypothetical protein n=1 Tax=Paenibacillus sp. JNUCC32 TaxID=2777984 RepID=UPI0017880733|nr:hypothetical protein [Paenibacillus sp. JNUCC-32]QOT13729.1 hypothetical protein JNUCC32_31065 [Paenibacillus sp. JNUCC-32]